MSHSVFICHATPDQHVVETEILPTLESIGLTYWYSHERLSTGEFQTAILDAIGESEWFLVVLSPQAVKSHWVKAEVHEAMGICRDRIVPVLVEECHPAACHMQLGGMNQVFWYEGSETAKKALQKIFQPTNRVASRSSAEISDESQNIIQQLRIIRDTSDTSSLVNVFHCLANEDPQIRDRARQALHAIGWQNAANVIASASSSISQDDMQKILDGLAALESHDKVVQLLDQLCNRLSGELRNRSIILWERKRLSLQLETLTEVFRRNQSSLTLEKVLGQGLTAASFLAKHAYMGEKQIVVRMLRPELACRPDLRRAFLSLAERACEYVHENLVMIRDNGQFAESQFYFYVRDYVHGMTLQDVLNSRQSLAPRQICHVMREIALALRPVHGRGHSHLGLKPSNIFLGENNKVTLGDPSLPVTLMGHDMKRLVYDFQYSAPENFASEACPGSNADLYSLGCVFFQLACGKPPFTSDSPFGLATDHASRNRPIPSKNNSVFGETADGLICSLLNPKPDTRLQTINEVLQSIDELEHRLTSDIRVQKRDSGPSLPPALAHSIAGFHDPGDVFHTRFESEPGTPKPSVKRHTPAMMDSREHLEQLVTLGVLSIPDINLNDETALKTFVAELAMQQRITEFQRSVILRQKLEPLVLDDRYLLCDYVGGGGMGMVYKAFDCRVERTVAVKMLRAVDNLSGKGLERFHREVVALGRLKHPNIITAYDAGEHRGSPFLVMELVEGRDLGALVTDNGPLAVQAASRMMIEAAVGLGYAHRKGVIHRDIKPTNLMLELADAEDDFARRLQTIKILDLGLARVASKRDLVGDEKPEKSLTVVDTTMGTVDYMAPEQASNAKMADHRSDIYSLGCTFYYLLTGKPMYDTDNFMAAMLAHVRDPIPSLRDDRTDVPSELDEVFAKMVAKEPDDRFQTWSSLIKALESFVVRTESASFPDVGELIGGSPSDSNSSFDSELASHDTQTEELPGPGFMLQAGDIPASSGSRSGDSDDRCAADNDDRSRDDSIVESPRRSIPPVPAAPAMRPSRSWEFGRPRVDNKRRQKKRSRKSRRKSDASFETLRDLQHLQDGVDDVIPVVEDRVKLAKSKTRRDEVDSTLFAPSHVGAGTSFLVQVYLHLPSQHNQARRLAEERDEEARERGATSLRTEIARGSQLSIQLRIPELKIDDDNCDIVWRGRPTAAQFSVRPPSDMSPQDITGRVLISQDSIPIGKIIFKLTVDNSDSQTALRPSGSSIRYRQAFVSYASEDRKEVLRRVQMLRAVGIGFFQDVLHLSPGDIWTRKLHDQIVECDVFFLFWSSAARRSEWVEKEWRFALTTKGDSFIQPVVIEGPPIPAPPSELQHLHFGDAILYFLHTRRRSFFSRLLSVFRIRQS